MEEAKVVWKDADLCCVNEEIRAAIYDLLATMDMLYQADSQATPYARKRLLDAVPLAAIARTAAAELRTRMTAMLSAGPC